MALIAFFQQHVIFMRVNNIFYLFNCINTKQVLKNIFIVLLLCFYTLFSIKPAVANEKKLDFSFFRLGTTNPVMLIVGGIQGDEPGGFSAATLLATRYKVTHGTLWIVPNLNFPSIIKRKRGLHGDMNRKFAILDHTDPEYQTVSRIQKLIRAKEVSVILNLHDGSGFYRKKYQNALNGPARWGQSIIIDQEFMPDFITQTHDFNTATTEHRLQFLDEMAQSVTKIVNKNLLHKDHYFEVRNTHTAKGDREMEKSLSWFAVRHGKPAFGLEASKEFSVVKRAYYHLQMVEAFAHLTGLEIERDFELTLKGVEEALYSGLSVSFMNNRIMLPLEDVRARINFLPLPKKDYAPIASKPIMAVLPNGKNLYVHYGNRTLTTIIPDWHDIDYSLDMLRVIVDGQEKLINFGSVITVQNDFKVLPITGYRVNAIGANSGKNNESNMLFTEKSFIKRFSVDNGGSIFRVEVYKDKSFCGMFMVRFTRPKQKKPQ